MLHKQSAVKQESNIVKKEWGGYDLDFDSKKGVLRKNSRHT